jgi:hypothetical protein
MLTLPLRVGVCPSSLRTITLVLIENVISIEDFQAASTHHFYNIFINFNS